MDDLTMQIENKLEFAQLICQRLAECIEKIGFPAGVIGVYPIYESAHFQLLQDPLTGKFNLLGFWVDKHGHKMGRLQFQSDDSCYAEYDVVQNHPTKKQWFVEKVTAWGKQDALKTEATLLELLE